MSATVFYESSSELATLSNTFTVSGVATDPTAVVLVVTSPTGTATTYNYPTPATITRTGTGVYAKDIACSEAGTWSFVWTGTGTASDVDAGTWQVDSVPSSDLYITPEALKSRAGITDTADDRELLGVCRSVSRWIDEHCDRVFARRTVTVQLDICGPYSVQTPDFVSITTLKTDDNADGTFETTWSASDYEAQPVNAALEVQPRPYTSIAAVGTRLFPVTYTGYGRRPRAQLVGVLGWPSLPSPVQQAAGLLGADYLAAVGMKFGVMSFDGYAVRARMNGAALEMLRPYRRHPVLMA